jgi:polyhydroxyalkanoate synthesis repressor PhaR
MTHCGEGEIVIRQIKRYNSRKLYDPEESRYVSLDEVSGWIRDGQQVAVVDNKSGEDVTRQTLIQIIAEDGRKGNSNLSQDFLHDLIRRSSDVVGKGVESLQQGVDKLLGAGLEKVGPVRRLKEETSRLRGRLEELESAIENYNSQPQRGTRNDPDTEG